jgi:hypothetical protein
MQTQNQEALSILHVQEQGVSIGCDDSSPQGIQHLSRVSFSTQSSKNISSASSKFFFALQMTRRKVNPNWWYAIKRSYVPSENDGNHTFDYFLH